MTRSTIAVAAVLEVVAAFAFGEQVEDLATEFPEFVGGALGAVAEQFLELAKCQFDRIEVGRVRRQITYRGARCFNGCDDARAFVAGEVIHHHHVAWPQHFDQLLFHPGLEQCAVDRSLDAQRSHKACRTQCSQEGRRFPATVGYCFGQTCSTKAAAIGAAHVRLGPRFVEENDAVRIELQLFGEPLSTSFGNIFATLFGRQTRLFFRVRRSARQARLRVTSDTSQPSSARAAATSSRR